MRKAVLWRQSKVGAILWIFSMNAQLRLAFFQHWSQSRRVSVVCPTLLWWGKNWRWGPRRYSGRMLTIDGGSWRKTISVAVIEVAINIWWSSFPQDFNRYLKIVPLAKLIIRIRVQTHAGTDSYSLKDKSNEKGRALRQSATVEPGANGMQRLDSWIVQTQGNDIIGTEWWSWHWNNYCHLRPKHSVTQ